MSFLEIEPVSVFSSGRSVSSHRVTADALAGQYLTALGDTVDWVKHPVVISALLTYYLDWQPKVREVADRIEALGNNTSGSSVVLVDADDESTTILGVPGAAAVAAGEDLGQPITAP